MHLEWCTICKKKLHLIQATIAPQKQREPSRDILSYVLHYHSQVQCNQTSAILKMHHYIQLRRWSLAFSLVILITAIAITLFSILPGTKSIPHILYIADTSSSKFHTKNS